MTPNTRLIRDFALAYAGALILVVVIAQLMQRFAGFDSGAMSSVVPLIGATFFAGARHAEREGTVPDGATSWAIAFPCTAIAFGISFLALAIAVLVIGEAAAREVQTLLSDPVTLAVIGGVLFVAHVLTIRFIVPMAARTQIRAAEKRKKR